MDKNILAWSQNSSSLPASKIFKYSIGDEFIEGMGRKSQGE
jgi:hypothetical protein